VISFQDNSFSQNAFSDAILISKNRDKYLENINLILKEEFKAQYTEKQKFDLDNLKKFLINPWDPSIVNLNLKVILDIAKIMLNFGQLEKSYERHKKVLEDLVIDLSFKIDNLKIQSSKILTIDSLSISQKNGLDSEIKNLENRNDSNKRIIKSIEESINSVQGTRNSTEIIDYEEFRISLENKNNVISQLGKDNESEVKETVNNAQFSISQAAIIEAIGNAIIEQVKEQVINNLLENVLTIKININDSVKTYFTDELKVFFPKTVNVLLKLEEEKTGNYYTNLNTTLKNVFNEDLKNIMNNITNEANLKSSKILGRLIFDINGNYKNDILIYLKLAQTLTENIKNGFHPVELIPMLQTYLENNNYLKNYAEYIAMIDLLQKNLRDVSDKSKNIWIDIIQFQELNIDKSFITFSNAEIFLAILFQSDKDKFKYIKEKFAPYNVFKDTLFKDFKTDLSEFVIILRKTEKNVEALVNSKEKSFEDYELYLNNFMILLKESNSLLSKYFFVDIKPISNKLELVEKYTNYSIQIYKSITNNTYSKILPVVLNIFNDQIMSVEESKSFKKELIRYTSLYIDISSANSQSELNSAINKAANNSGGYLRKFEDNFTISVNSYPGFYCGWENINNTKYNFTPGFTVPVGVNFQFYHHFGIFAQAFDLAAAVNYRFNSEGTTNLPAEVTFRQVFSPGVFLNFNFSHSLPLTLNAGIYITPALRNIDLSNVTLNESKSVRFGLNVSYDVPLWFIL